MTCQHCQTWVLDDDHRCRRCGRRVRATPSRISPETYPIAATATATAYDFDTAEDTQAMQPSSALPSQPRQQSLFSSTPMERRVIPFDSLTSAAERDAIRTRAADVARPEPVRHGKVEVRHAKPKRTHSISQRRLDFLGQQEVLSQPQTDIICDAPVAPAALRTKAALVDGILMACGCLFGLAFYLFAGGALSADKHVLPFLAAAFITVPVFYKFLWVFAGQDSIGVQRAGTRLVDFDGNPPSNRRRYLRFLAGFVSVLAAGVGLIWALVDQDGLTWHDHISGTFPTIYSLDDELAGARRI